jgi:hypothetical protein
MKPKMLEVVFDAENIRLHGLFPLIGLMVSPFGLPWVTL